jgi:hypothetical protein
MALQHRADNPLRLCPEEFLDDLALAKELYGRDTADGVVERKP